MTAAPARILIVKPSSLGDVISAVPVLRGMRRTFPQASIDWLVFEAFAPILQGDSDLSQAIVVRKADISAAWRSRAACQNLMSLRRQLRDAQYDWAIDLQGLIRSGLLTGMTGAPLRAGFAQPREKLAKLFYTTTFAPSAPHAVDRNIELGCFLGADCRSGDFRLQVQPQARELVKQLLAQRGIDGQYIVCVPPTRWPTKIYPTRHWRSVVAALSQRVSVVVAGSASRDEMELCATVAHGLDNVANMAGLTNLPQLVAMIAGSAGVICSDSAAQYIAPAVGVDVVSLIGPTQPQKTGPYGLGRSLSANLTCSGCLRRQCSHISCMQLIRPDEVVSAAEQMLSKAGAV